MRYLLLVPFFFFSLAVDAQIGGTISWLAPKGNLGPIFKKAPSFELFYNADFYENRVNTRIGFHYVSLRPRLDSFPTFSVRYDNHPTIFPGWISYQKFTLSTVFFDIQLKIAQVKQFYLYGGIGGTAGFNRLEYTRRIETLLNEQRSIVRTIMGFRGSANLEYKVNDHLGVFLSAKYSGFRQGFAPPSFRHDTIGVGFVYSFKNNNNFY